MWKKLTKAVDAITSSIEIKLEQFSSRMNYKRNNKCNYLLIVIIISALVHVCI